MGSTSLALVFGAAAALVVVGCPEHAPLAERSGGGGQNAGSGAASASTGKGGSPPEDCASACEKIYDCGLENDTKGMPLCPGFDGTMKERAAFVADCVAQCEAFPAFGTNVASADCPSLVKQLQSFNSDFESACANGVSTSSTVSSTVGAASGGAAVTSSGATASSTGTGK